MATYDYDIGIIGGGAAGLTVAAGCSQLGGKTLLIERESLGGDCLHFGCVPSKTLIRAAEVYHLMRRAGDFGLPSPDIPPVDFARVRGRIREVIATIAEHDSVERFCSLGAEVRFGEPRFADEHAVDLDGGRITAKTWVLATGSSSAAPPIPGLDDVDVLTNRDIFSLDELPESLVILGGGAVACEMAQAFCRLGAHVEVVQRGGQVLGREDPDMAAMVRDALADEGVVFHLGATVTGVRQDGMRGHGGRKEVDLTLAGGERRTIAGSALLAALGRSPNTGGLGLEDVGVTLSPGGGAPGGVVVDDRLRSSQAHIFAAGDVLGRHMFTHAAGYEGSIVVTNAMFHLPRKADYTWLPRCTYVSPELACMGHTETSARAAGLEPEVIAEEFKANDRALAQGETRGRIKVVLAKGRPVGVSIFGPHAGEVLSEWVAVLNGGVGLSTLAGATHPYPTLAEINKRVAGTFLGKKIFSDKVRKTLGFFFNYKGNACTPGD